MGDKLRIYVGGLGSRVQVSDLQKIFSSPQLGAVQSVEIIRTKCRSFAYLDFVPASEKGLLKLFSTYNGCMWKGGKLKIEKAKENYLCRLQREWKEDAELETKLSGHNVDADKRVHALLKSKNKEDIEKMQLKMFFPKLRKIKAIPFKGTGRHKYSFQRIEAPPLPVHFCDCEEHAVTPEPAKRNHSGLPELAKRNNADDHEVDNYGVKEEELKMMKSVLGKLLKKEIHSENVTSEAAEPTEEIQHDASPVDKWQVDDDEEEDQVSDEDGIVINIVGRSSKRVSSFEDCKTSTTNQDTLVSEPVSKTQGTKSANHLVDKKRKQSVHEDKINDTVPSKKKGRMGDSNDSTYEQVGINAKPVDEKSGSARLSRDVAYSNKKAWKGLVNEGSAAFRISDIWMNHSSDTETEPVSDLATEPGSNENNGQQEQTPKHEKSEKPYDVQSTEPTESKDLLARGASWKQKSSWLQLIADKTASSFSLSQVLPGVTSKEQPSQQSKDIGISTLRGEEKHSSMHNDDKSYVEDIGEPQDPTPRIANEDVFTKGGNNHALNGEQMNSYSNDKVEMDSSAPVVHTYPVPDNRAMGDIVVSETCPFMRSSASRKEWEKSKAALSGSRKKKGQGKESVQG